MASMEIPKVAIAFGPVAPSQGDVVGLSVHLGCTKEVSSFECALQNWDGKYNANGASPINVGMDGSISIGRGTNVPQIITCRVESLRFESTPAESYLNVSGRCWGERLFRRVVTKTYEGKRGEEIVKDLMDNYVGLGHVRGQTELVEYTDTTYTRLKYENTPVMDILRHVAESSDKAGVIGFDFRVAPDGKFEFFPVDSKPNSLSLAEKIEHIEYSKDISRVRNRVVLYGAAEKSVPADKDSWTESLTPQDGSWSAPSGTVTLDTETKVKGSASIKSYNSQAYYASSMFTLSPDKQVDASLYPTLDFWVRRDTPFNGNVSVVLYDANDKFASHLVNVGPDKWSQQQIKVGADNADAWEHQAGFNWALVKKIRFDCWFDNTGTGSFWVDGLCFGGRRCSSVNEDAASQTAYGLRELVDVDEELCSDAECEYRAKATVAYLKDPAEHLTVRSTLVDYGNDPILPGQTLHIVLPNEDVDADFRVLSVEYDVDAKAQTLELTLELGRERPPLADYLFALQSKTSHLSRHKKAR